MKTTRIKPHEARKRWVVVDAKDQVLGRLASRIAHLLRGKHLPTYSPNANHGDVVIVLNADHIKLTGDKLEQKTFQTYSGYPGGLKKVKYSIIMDKKPDQALRRAVWGMLAHGRMGREQLRGLKIYRGATHPHVAQQPVNA